MSKSLIKIELNDGKIREAFHISSVFDKNYMNKGAKL